MAKTINCPFCKKELTKKFLGGDSNFFSIGIYKVDCCDDCCEKYENMLSKDIQNRIEIKLANFAYSTKIKLKDDNDTLAKLVEKYLNEAQELESNRERFDIVNFKTFYGIESGKFWVEEFKLGWLDSSVSLNDMVKARKKAESGITTSYFTKDDITKLEYRIASTGPVSVFMPFKHICSVDVRLNDEKNLSYKPAITRLVFSYTTLPIFLEKKSAIKNTEKILKEFKADIGTNLPIVRVKKFK